MSAAALSLAAAAARRADYDRYLVALFAPPPRREALFALIAFNAEIAKVRDTVSEALLGQIRLQWWREAVDEIFAGRSVRKHEIALALAAAVRSHGIERGLIDRLIDGRERDLDPAPFETDAELGVYVQATSSALAEAMAQALGAGDPASLAAARVAGEGWGRIGLIRALPFQARRKRNAIPRALAQSVGLTEGDYFELRDTPPLRQAVAGLLKSAVAVLDTVPPAPDRRLRPVLLLARLARLYAQAIERRRYDVLGAPIEIGRARKIAKLWWAARF